MEVLVIPELCTRCYICVDMFLQTEMKFINVLCTSHTGNVMDYYAIMFGDFKKAHTHTCRDFKYMHKHLYLTCFDHNIYINVITHIFVEKDQVKEYYSQVHRS